ncbi:MAG: SPFH domain-containing protein [Bacteroidetes bacterium]|nr:MAG: SPFH domain-containing protein [Bacteroidota bacterium]TAG86969.1 MAG: SPFH domain-containing protein [Bacteroidota bacterium]
MEVNKEKVISPPGGFTMLFLGLIWLGLSVGCFFIPEDIIALPIKIGVGVVGAIGALVVLYGLVLVNPNTAYIYTFFGGYEGSIKKNGLFWINPFTVGSHISLRAKNFDTEKIKVNDKLGNPIMIGAILVWLVKDTYKAHFEVDNYENFVKIQSEAAIRNLAGSYPYDNFDDAQADITLRSGLQEVNQALENELQERLSIAGIEIVEARISYLAYAPEIANAMLRRQQATAVVSARFKIVEGAVSMVEMALSELSKKGVVDLDEDKKATMVSNLMVVLCSDKDASPVINTGTLHQ